MIPSLEVRSFLTWLLGHPAGPVQAVKTPKGSSMGLRRQCIGGLRNRVPLTFLGKNPNSHKTLANLCPANPRCDLGGTVHAGTGAVELEMKRGFFSDFVPA